MSIKAKRSCASSASRRRAACRAFRSPRRTRPRASWAARYGWSRRRSMPAAAARAAASRWRSRSTRCINTPPSILGMTLVTHQTGPEGRVVQRLLVEEGADIRKELYVGMVVDRGTQRVTLDRELRGRHGDRGSRRAHARENSQGGHRSGRRASPTPRRTTSRARSACPRRRWRRRAASCRGCIARSTNAMPRSPRSIR